MSENTQDKKATAKPAAKKAKKEKIEDKPFQNFINDDFVPALKSAFKDEGVEDIELSFTNESLPALTGANASNKCWQIIGNWKSTNRKFNLYFLDENIKGQKAFSYSIYGKAPSTIESFMIDEKRVTLGLMVMYTIQRLNSQKWLTGN